MNRGLSYPLLEEGREDYKNLYYKVDHIESGEDYLIFEHKLLGDGLISELIKNNEAKFVTVCVLKSALYRNTISEYDEVITSLHIKMKIPLLDTNEKMDFYSYIVYIGEDKEILLDEKSGVSDFWLNEKIYLKKGSILAKDGWRELQSSASDILLVKKDENEKYGFNVTVSSQEGGRFIVNVKPELFDKLSKLPDNDLHRRSIIIHMLCLGFMKLHQEFKEDDSELTNFNAIKNELKSNGIKTWDEDDFSPNDVACYFYPHILPESEND